ncbi:Demethylrebeccamycin-D-glucose O-methyltransferase [Cytospora mali]|uniref:Demethylrebeccamycin-D-glucose O-methyltransferase n=1 Tax=Cytospora mali TaxID=578113 RepID=A0A194UVH7_CYTMA|nr:Demethylrebeccamycin-D-glucose O-methyltransferase [Valsa mali var. pyri (nom. inval.)]
MGSDSVPENLKARLKDSYDAIAERYTEWSIRTSDIRVGYLDKLLALLSPSHNDILEIGCGAGIPTTEKLLAHSPGFRITANDLSSSQIALGKKRLGEDVVGGGSRVTWIEGDMMQLDLPDGSFDVVLGFYTIQHLPRDEQSVMIRRVAKWLKPGGYMLINFPAQEDENVVMTGWMGEKGWVYHSGWGAEKYRQLVKETGLELVLDEVKQDNVKAEFLWIIGKKCEA